MQQKQPHTNRFSIRRRAKIVAKQRVMRCLLPVMEAVLICVLPIILIAGPIQTYIYSTGQLLFPIVLFVAAVILLIMPLVYGLMGFLMRVLTGERPPLLCVFDGLAGVENYLRSVKLGLCIFVHIVLWMIIPIAATAGYCYLMLLRDPAILENAEKLYQLILQMSGLYLVIMIPFLARILRYFIAYPMIMREPSLGAWQATRQAARAFKGHNLRLIVLVVSFFGWQLVGMWTMGIGTLFYWGYLLSALLMYFWYLEHPDGGENQQSESIPEQKQE